MNILSVFSAIPAVAGILLVVVIGIILLEAIILLNKRKKKPVTITPMEGFAAETATVPATNAQQPTINRSHAKLFAAIILILVAVAVPVTVYVVQQQQDVRSKAADNSTVQHPPGYTEWIIGGFPNPGNNNFDRCFLYDNPCAPDTGEDAYCFCEPLGSYPTDIGCIDTGESAPLGPIKNTQNGTGTACLHPSPSPTPTTEPAPICRLIKVYTSLTLTRPSPSSFGSPRPSFPATPTFPSPIVTTSGLQPTPPSELKNLKPGDVIEIAVVGDSAGKTFDKARFNINAGAPIETTSKNQFGEYFISFTIPTNVTNFTFAAELHVEQTNKWY